MATTSESTRPAPSARQPRPSVLLQPNSVMAFRDAAAFLSPAHASVWSGCRDDTAAACRRGPIRWHARRAAAAAPPLLQQRRQLRRRLLDGGSVTMALSVASKGLPASVVQVDISVSADEVAAAYEAVRMSEKEGGGGGWRGGGAAAKRRGARQALLLNGRLRWWGVGRGCSAEGRTLAPAATVLDGCPPLRPEGVSVALCCQGVPERFLKHRLRAPAPVPISQPPQLPLPLSPPLP